MKAQALGAGVCVPTEQRVHPPMSCRSDGFRRSPQPGAASGLERHGQLPMMTGVRTLEKKEK
jgi:hypothetical protein